MKVGKEEVLGILMAVEMWVKRDQQAEWNRWVSWMEQIATRVREVPGATTTVRDEPGGLSHRSAGLSITWDTTQIGLTGAGARAIRNYARSSRSSSNNVKASKSGQAGNSQAVHGAYHPSQAFTAGHCCARATPEMPA